MNVGNMIKFVNDASTPILNFEFMFGGQFAEIVALGSDGITVRLADHHECLDEWDNELIWQWVDCFDHLDLDEDNYSDEERFNMFFGWLCARVCEVLRPSHEDEQKAKDAAMVQLMTLPSVTTLEGIGLWHDDVDAACLAVQSALGVTDGGLASQMLSDDWRGDFGAYVEAELQGVREELEAKL